MFYIHNKYEAVCAIGSICEVLSPMLIAETRDIILKNQGFITPLFKFFFFRRKIFQLAFYPRALALRRTSWEICSPAVVVCFPPPKEEGDILKLVICSDVGYFIYHHKLA